MFQPVPANHWFIIPKLKLIHTDIRRRFQRTPRLIAQLRDNEVPDREEVPEAVQSHTLLERQASCNKVHQATGPVPP
jgi:hypothetical protein